MVEVQVCLLVHFHLHPALADLRGEEAMHRPIVSPVGSFKEPVLFLVVTVVQLQRGQEDIEKMLIRVEGYVDVIAIRLEHQGKGNLTLGRTADDLKPMLRRFLRHTTLPSLKNKSCFRPDFSPFTRLWRAYSISAQPTHTGRNYQNYSIFTSILSS